MGGLCKTSSGLPYSNLYFVTRKEADEYYKKTGDVILDEHTIEQRDYVIKLGLPKEKIRMQYQQCGTPVTEPLVI